MYDVTSNTYKDKKIVLKRALEVSFDKLVSYKNSYNRLDTYMYENEGKVKLPSTENISDSFLLEVLKIKKNETRITDIIKSIQSEQNKIIRLNEKTNSVVLGCAGSGKTMISFHRLAYLKFHSKIDFKKTVIITPSNSFKEVFNELSSMSITR
jgi:DNA helicase-2/ATP-dependent DNA helicase PcrA